MIRSVFLTLAAGALSVCLAQDLVIQGGTLVAGGGAEPMRGAGVVVRKGKVAELSHEFPDEARIDRYPGAVITPGFVDLRTHLGGLGDLDESAEAFGNDIDVLPAVNLQDASFKQALRAGITSCVVLPGDGAVFGGRGALLKTTGTVVKGVPAVAKLALSNDVLRDDRAPTSAVMAYSQLRERLEASHTQGKDAFSAFARGDIPGLCKVDDPGNARRMLRLAEALGLRMVLHLDPAQGPAFKDLQLKGLPVVCGPYDFDAPRASLRLPVQLAAAGADVCFTSSAPRFHVKDLRGSAVLAISEGLSLSQGLEAITGAPARALGIGDKVGSLKAGADADVLVWSGHPMRAGSRLLAVYVDGRRVWRSAHGNGGGQ